MSARPSSASSPLTKTKHPEMTFVNVAQCRRIGSRCTATASAGAFLALNQARESTRRISGARCKDERPKACSMTCLRTPTSESTWDAMGHTHFFAATSYGGTGWAAACGRAPEVKQPEMRAGSTRCSSADRDRQRFRRPPCRLGLPLGRHDRTQPQPLGPPPAGPDGCFETALLRLTPSVVPCANHINRACANRAAASGGGPSELRAWRHFRLRARPRVPLRPRARLRPRVRLRRWRDRSRSLKRR